jgi:hypothetical protein
MADFFVEDSAARRAVRLGDPIAQGAAGTIHRIVGEPGVVAKLYKNPKDLPEYRAKISAMLLARPNLPSFKHDGREYVQIAWPTAAIVDKKGGFRGFLMPEVDFQASTELENILQRSARLRKQLPEFSGARVLLAANLAALMADLHALGHYMVDMKPINMRFYPRRWNLAILDTDGFSVNGVNRVPAKQFSDEYIAPEAAGKKPEQLGHDQDCFALAVIIFRLLNNGIHPYQGVDASNHPTTLQERVFAGLYAYGVKLHPTVKPSPASVHSYLEKSTRALFDQAFQAKSPRPAATEWRDHLYGLIQSKTLVKCSVKPTEHAHFSKGCGFCALEKLKAKGRSTTATYTSKAGHKSAAVAPPRVQVRTPVKSPTSARNDTSLLKKALIAIAGVALLYYAVNTSEKSGQTSRQVSNTPPVSTTQTGPTPPISAGNLIIAKAIDANGVLLDQTRSISGPNASVVLQYTYRQAKPYQDKVSARLTGIGRSYNCNETYAQITVGTFSCVLRNVDVGHYTAQALLNGQPTSQAFLHVTTPLPAPLPAEATSSTNTSAEGGPFVSPIPKLLSQIESSPSQCAVAGCTAQMTNSAWNIRSGVIPGSGDGILYLRPVSIASSARAYLVLLRDGPMCAVVACSANLWLNTGSGFKMVFEGANIWFREELTNGVPDILLGYKGPGTESQGPFRHYRWSGSAYLYVGTVDLRTDNASLPTTSVSSPSETQGSIVPNVETPLQPAPRNPTQARQRLRECNNEWRERSNDLGMPWDQFMRECTNRL